MNYVPVRLLSLMLLAIILCFGCVRQPDASSPVAKPEGLPGTYRVLWSDETPDSNIFTVENDNGELWMFNEEKEYPLFEMPREDVEAVFGKEMADNAQCMESRKGSVIFIICAAEPGLKTTVKIDGLDSYSTKFTTKTNHFIFIDDMGIWDMEKLK